MVEAIPATTDTGRGLVLPAAKALSHVLIVHTAIDRGWPLSIGDAELDLDDARNHMRDAVVPTGLMTPEAEGAYHHWAEEISSQIELLRGTANDEDPAAEVIDRETLKVLAENAWQLMTILDRELTGLSPRDTDPGRLP